MRRKRKLNMLFLILFWIFIYMLLFSIWLLWTYASFSLPSPRLKRTIIPDFRCPKPMPNLNKRQQRQVNNASSTTALRILLLLQPDQMSTVSRKTLENFFDYFKVPVLVESHLPGERLLLELGERARFALVVFSDYRIFHSLSSHEKALLREFCARHSAGVISFLELPLMNGQQRIEFANFTAFGRQSVTKLAMAKTSPIHHIAKTGIEHHFAPNYNKLECTLLKPTLNQLMPILEAESETGEQLSVALHLEERHVVFGAKPDLHWLVQIALLDSVSFLAPAIHTEDLERFVQVDIDDIFVAASGSRMVADDVEALFTLQDNLREHIDNFHFTLGFSGYFFRHGDASEMQGDEILVSNANKLHWFPHMWRHNHPNEFSYEYLLALMTQNRVFAQNVGLSANLSYAVSPQHSGVYPIYQPLYDAWHEVWSVRVASTEEYPHLRPANRRRAFVHGSVTVIPRQTCGLFTHTQFFHAYPDGVDNFLRNIFGGEMFIAVLMNKFSIFMTHQQNFANDRLGAFAFTNLVKFVACWTNLRLKWITPTNLAAIYLRRFPNERTLLYTNPCDDPRHRRLLPLNFNCTSLKLPNLLILGPQKTGTSALGLFLSLHPNISTNVPILNSFEELQFFGGPNYSRGFAWYAAQFVNSPPTASMLFEKTANYFDNTKVPAAVHALLPNAKLVIILDDPAQRAYSWYQHMRAHNDSAALNYSADQLFISNNESVLDDEEFAKLRRRCLWPGLYARHIDQWLNHFAPTQLLFVDGHRLRTEPYFMLAELFAKLQLPQVDGLHRLLRYSAEKGFYCAVLSGQNGSEGGQHQQRGDHRQQRLHCLGRSKGRHYEPMSYRLKQHLEAFFDAPNAELRALFRKYRFQLPSFLLQN